MVAVPHSCRAGWWRLFTTFGHFEAACIQHDICHGTCGIPIEDCATKQFDTLAADVCENGNGEGGNVFGRLYRYGWDPIIVCNFVKSVTVPTLLKIAKKSKRRGHTSE
jgi:hypothetical protein